MTDHIQIHVQKQGSIDETTWSDRTLTIDAATETATVSRHDHPSDLYHHSMRVLGIQKWGDMKATNSGHGHDSAEAKMTLHLMGVKVPAVKFGGADAKSNTNGGTPHEHPSPSSHHPGGASSEVDSSWMVRCLTQEDYHAAVTLLEKIVHARQQREAGHHGHKEAAENGVFIPGPEVGVTVPNSMAAPVL